MDLAGITTMIGMASKAISNFSEDELGKLAVTIAGDNAPSVLAVLKQVQVNEPNTTAQTILKSDTMKGVFEFFLKSKDAVEDAVFCRCPVCGSSFEQSLVSA